MGQVSEKLKGYETIGNIPLVQVHNETEIRPHVKTKDPGDRC